MSNTPRQSLAKAPLPFRDGVAPSYVNVPYGDWPSIYQFLLAKFPRLDPDILKGRIEKGDLVYQNGQTVQCADPVVEGDVIWYYREVANEPVVPFSETVIYEDERIIVADKPHLLSTTPAGRFLKQTLLSRLRHRYENPDIAPAHRLDRETAGLVLLTKAPAYRSPYQRLFEARQVTKHYHAIAPLNRALRYPYCHRSHMTKGRHFFTMQECLQRPANSETHIELLEVRGRWGLYKLSPVSGKQHQLRLHMASLGMPILNDRWYPSVLAERAADNFSQPLQLLAKTLSFTDPISGQVHHFESQQVLNLA